MEAIGMSWDECVGVRRWVNVFAAVLVISILLHQQFLLGLIGVILFQMLWRERLAQGKLLWVANAEVFAE